MTRLIDFDRGGDECLRWWRVKTPWLGIRLHRWITADEPGFSHDHHWAFVTFVLRGGYIDRSYIDGREIDDRLRAGSVRFRPAEHEHTILECEGCWTLVFMGPTVREGQAFIDHVAVPWSEWFGRVCGR